METIAQAREAIKTIKSLQNELIRFTEKLAENNRQIQKKDFSMLNNFRFAIVRKMVLLLEKYDEPTALEIVFDEYKNIICRREYLFCLWNHVKKQRGALDLYARRYMAKKMRESGYKINEIALTMGLSKTSINKLLAC